MLGFLLAWRTFLWFAAITSLLAWIGLGILAACLAKQPLSPRHILTRFSAQQIPPRTPLPWHGTLRSEPTRLPWGYGFASWPKLKTHVESLQTVGQLKQAIDANDLERVKQLMTRNPELHRAPLGYGKNLPVLVVRRTCRYG